MSDVESLGELLVLVRMRNHGRTYWQASDGVLRMSYPPRVTQREAIERFQVQRQHKHKRVLLYTKHHSLAQASKLLAGLFGLTS
jgi:hypothetical protein